MSGSLIALLESDLQLVLMVSEFRANLTYEKREFSLEFGFGGVRILEYFVNP